MKLGEGGIHRRNDKRASGERIQALAEISVHLTGEFGPEQILDGILIQRAQEIESRAGKKGQAAASKTVTPEVARIYHVADPRHVRDPRTKVRRNNLDAVLAGDLDDFILGYLRETEARTAWEGRMQPA